MRSLTTWLAMLQIVGATAALAQQASNPARIAQAPTAKLLVATEGVFELALGKSIDVTDRKILLSFPRAGRNEIGSNIEKGLAYLSINGRSASNPNSSGCCEIPVGSRVDLKRFSDKLGDRAECVLDVVDLNTPKGGQPTVTLRLSCP